VSGLRTCQSCGFEAAEMGKACPLCGTVAVQEDLTVDAGAPDALPGIDAAIREVGAGASEVNRCVKCARPFAVVYEPTAGEATCQVPAACPYCWHVNHVAVGRDAADAQQYRVEKMADARRSASRVTPRAPVRVAAIGDEVTIVRGSALNISGGGLGCYLHGPKLRVGTHVLARLTLPRSDEAPLTAFARVAWARASRGEDAARYGLQWEDGADLERIRRAIPSLA